VQRLQRLAVQRCDAPSQGINYFICLKYFLHIIILSSKA
jgi:hypothetical protein